MEIDMQKPYPAASQVCRVKKATGILVGLGAHGWCVLWLPCWASEAHEVISDHQQVACGEHTAQYLPCQR